MNVYLGGPVEYSDMQGPCPAGFHVPTDTEWQSVYNAGVSLGAWSSSNGVNFSTYLKIPLGGYRNYYSLSLGSRGEYGNYWTSVANGDSYAKSLLFDNTSITTPSNASGRRSDGRAIRGFKDIPAVPDSGWTVLYQGSGSAGIYYKSDLGLISISSDGSTWITIADKNLGATTVYNYGDTLSESNCGKVYQRGNNYGFSGDENYNTSLISQSSTKVNVTGYGPGNYYESSTWITDVPRQSSDNNGDNLRGGVSQGTSTKSVEMQNAYIGEKPYDGDELCFTANTANSTVSLVKTGSPTSVTFETSTDGRTWTTYTFDSTITLSNIGDKVYWRNTSETDTLLNSTYYNGNLYQFVMTGSIAASGDVNYLLNKNSTTTLSNYCYPRLFKECMSLTTPPKLPATTLAEGCYREMFYMCTNLTALPSLDVTTLAMSCYERMFEWCTKIKLSTTQTGEYQTPYRIPTTGTGTTATYSMYYMFNNTNGTFTGTPSINTTYYTSNTVV